VNIYVLTSLIEVVFGLAFLTLLIVGSKWPVARRLHVYEERRFLSAVSAGVATSVDRANHLENIKRQYYDIQRTMEGITHAVSLLIGSRDPYTAGHQRRVAALARAIAEAIGLSEWQIRGVFIAGLLHDVGKVSVPLEILSKPGKLNAGEYAIVKSHCQIGYEVLRRIEFPWPVTRAIFQHHERLDGSGYPEGLTGSDIILEARILGVADVVEAMSSHRPYRPSLGLDSALAEISLGSGTLYDSDIVAACLRLFQKNAPGFDRLMAAAAAEEQVLEAVR
jgi:putative nucleotidyltransferase with HDIG domain